MPAIDCKCQGTGLFFEDGKPLFCGCMYGQRVKAINEEAKNNVDRLIKGWYRQIELVSENEAEAFVNYSANLEEMITNRPAWVLPYIFDYFHKKNLDISYKGVVYDMPDVENTIKLLRVLEAESEQDIQAEKMAEVLKNELCHHTSTFSEVCNVLAKAGFKQS